MRILYLYPASAFGGASKSLIELYGKIKSHGVTGTVICPPGKASEQFQRAGLRTIHTFGLSQFDNTRFGYYRGFRWFILIREFLLLPFSFFALLKAKQVKPGFDLIHVNEATLLSLGILAKWFFKLPLVVHVRSVQRSGNHWRSRFFSYLLRKYADEVICIDDTVRRSLPADLPCVVIHNGLILASEAVAASKQGHSPITLGYVGSLLRLKGIYELLEAVQILALERGLKFKLLIFGENVRDVAGFKAGALKCMGFCDDVEKDVEDFISRHALQDVIELRGFAPDVRDIYPLLDVLCFPSHLNAAGRPVFEAAFFGIPSLVAMDSPLDDAAQHEITALVIDRPTPQLIADALERLIRDDVLREELGCNARLWAQRYFDMDKNADQLFGIYSRILTVGEN